jgi:hypothetical protein
MKRPADKGKGADGVVEKADGYVNPASDMLDDVLTSAESTKGLDDVLTSAESTKGLDDVLTSAESTRSTGERA